MMGIISKSIYGYLQSIVVRLLYALPEIKLYIINTAYISDD